MGASDAASAAAKASLFSAIDLKASLVLSVFVIFAGVASSASPSSSLLAFA